MMDANGPVDLVGWKFQGRDGKWMLEDDDLELKHSALDYFMGAFPPNALKRILLLTNKSLQKNEGKEIELGELFWFFGVVLLIARFDFGQRHELWNVQSPFKYIPSPQFRICTFEIWTNLVHSQKNIHMTCHQ
jgi:Transposase IS4